jgi:hypothetical protein
LSPADNAYRYGEQNAVRGKDRRRNETLPVGFYSGVCQMHAKGKMNHIQTHFKCYEELKSTIEASRQLEELLNRVFNSLAPIPDSESKKMLLLRLAVLKLLIEHAQIAIEYMISKAHSVLIP